MKKSKKNKQLTKILKAHRLDRMRRQKAYEALKDEIVEKSSTIFHQKQEILLLRNICSDKHNEIKALERVNELTETSIRSCERALEYKEIRETDNAEFMAKVIRAIE